GSRCRLPRFNAYGLTRPTFGAIMSCLYALALSTSSAGRFAAMSKFEEKLNEFKSELRPILSEIWNSRQKIDHTNRVKGIQDVLRIYHQERQSKAYTAKDMHLFINCLPSIAFEGEKAVPIIATSHQGILGNETKSESLPQYPYQYFEKDLIGA